MADVKAPEPHEIIQKFDKSILPPHNKKISLTLVYFKPTNSYQVQAITNTTWYAPDDWLSRDVVREICNLPNWDVTMAQSHFFSTMIGNVKSVVPVPVP